MRQILLGLGIWFIITSAYSQSLLINFKLGDKESKPVEKAKIILKLGENIIQTHSDKYGKAQIKLPIPKEPLLITIWHPLYETIKDTVKIPENKKSITLKYTLTLPQYELSEVTLTGTLLPIETKQFLYPVKIIKTKELEELGAVNVYDALRQTTNIRLNNDPVLGSRINLMGISGRQVKVLIDGIPVNGRLDGQVDLSQLSTNQLQQVEVIYGPLSLQYGSDALGGTIHLITKKDLKNEVSVSNYYETVGRFETNASVKLKKIPITLDFSRIFFNGWSEGDPFIDTFKPFKADSGRVKQWKPRELYSSRILFRKGNNKAEFTAQLLGSFDKIKNRGYPNPPFFTSAFDDIYKTVRIQPYAKFRYLIKEWQVQSTVSYNYFSREKLTVVKDLTSLAEEPVADPTLQDTTTFQDYMIRIWAQQQQPYENFPITFFTGIEYSNQKVLGDRLNDSITPMKDLSGFLQAQYKINNWTLTSALRGGYNNQFKVPIIPVIALQWQMKHWKVVSSYAQGFRAPSFKERYLYFVDINHNIQGNPDLKPERSKHYQLNISYQKKKYYVQLFGFLNDIKDLITLVQVNFPLYSYRNIGKWKTWGAQFNNGWFWKKWNFRFSGSFTVQETPYYRANIPEFSANVKYNLKNWELSLFTHWFGKSTLLILEKDNITTGQISPYTLSDFSINRTFLLNKWKIIWNLGIQNIFNIRQATLPQSGAAHGSNSNAWISYGRTLFTRLSIRLQP